MRIEQGYGKPGKVVVLDLPGVGLDADAAGAVVAAMINAARHQGLYSVKVLRDEVRVRTLFEFDDIYGWGVHLEELARAALGKS